MFFWRKVIHQSGKMVIYEWQNDWLGFKSSSTIDRSFEDMKKDFNDALRRFQK
jgi:hypothetical protein